MSAPLILAEMSDEQLFAEYVDKNNQSAFAELHTRHSRLVQDWLRKEFYFQYRGQEADIMQDAFLKVHQDAATFDRKDGTFRPWLFEIAKNVAINEGVKAKTEKRGGKVAIVNLTRPDEAGSDNAGGIEPVARPETMIGYETTEDGDVVEHPITHEALHEMVESLDPEDQAIMKAMVFDELGERDTAALLGLTRYRVRIRHAEILETLKQKVQAA